MGGPGVGHKSWKARQSRLVNIQKARAARRRTPLPWRGEMESRIIEQLVYQWWITDSGEWRVTSGEKYQLQIPHTAKTRPVRNDNVKSLTGHRVRRQERPWAKYKVARLLGVSHTWVNKLVKRFAADPERMRRRMAAFAPTSFEKLEQAREETRRQRERGWLRGPIRTRRVKLTLWGKKRVVTLPTRSEKRRTLLRQGYGGQAGSEQLPYRELPMWARGLILPGGMAVTGPHATDPPGSPSRGPGRPRFTRAVPFAFRRPRR